MGIPISRRLALLRMKLGRSLPHILAIIGVLVGGLGVAMAIDLRRQDEIERALLRKGYVCITARDIKAGERVSPDEVIQCVMVQYRTDLLPDILRDDSTQNILFAAPQFLTDHDRTMVAVHDIPLGHPVSAANFFVPPRIVPDQAVVVIAGFDAVDPYSDIVLVYPVPFSDEEIVIPEYPEARWLRVQGKCLEITEKGCLFVISEATLFGQRIMSPDNILAVISGNDTLRFLEMFALVTSHNVWYTNVPSLPEDRRFVPVVPSPSDLIPPSKEVPTPPPVEITPTPEAPTEPLATETPEGEEAAPPSQ